MNQQYPSWSIRDLYLACLNREQHDQTCGYWYTVTAGTMAHIAFATKEELLDWLEALNLKLIDTLPEERGTFKAMAITGCYYKISYQDVEEFKAISPLLKIAVMDNANFTLGKVTEDAHGIRTQCTCSIPMSKSGCTFPTM